jgi:hypothetical protein
VDHRITYVLQETKKVKVKLSLCLTKYHTVNIYTYLLLTPWCRILFEKLIVTQLVKNIPLSYGTGRFITVFTKARHWTLS